jgi:hypothetical protein
MSGGRSKRVERDVEPAQLRERQLEGRCPMGSRSWVGVEWSAVATVRSGCLTVSPRRRRPSNAWGLVTSWTRWRSMPMESGPGPRDDASPASSGQRAGSAQLASGFGHGRAQQRRWSDRHGRWAIQGHPVGPVRGSGTGPSAALFSKPDRRSRAFEAPGAGVRGAKVRELGPLRCRSGPPPAATERTQRCMPFGPPSQERPSICSVSLDSRGGCRCWSRCDGHPGGRRMGRGEERPRAATGECLRRQDHALADTSRMSVDSQRKLHQGKEPFADGPLERK